MVAAFVIWSIIALVFLIIGIIDWRSKSVVRFMAFTKPTTVKDVKGFNHSVALIWIAFAILLELLGIPLLLVRHSLLIFTSIMYSVAALIGLSIMSYILIDVKYIK